MYNENKVITANAEGFTVYYTDNSKHFTYTYHQPLLPHLQKLHLFEESYRGKHYQQFEQDDFTLYQNRLYKDAVYGLSTYTAKELDQMPIKHKLEIKKVHTKAQQVLNQWKQEIVSKLVDDLLRTVFYKSKSVKELIALSDGYTSRQEINKLRFSELNIHKIDIAVKLMEEDILPANFLRQNAMLAYSS